MNSGRSSGRHWMSSSLMTWLTTPPPVFTPGQISALTKCSGTFMWIFLLLSTRWKSTCSTSGRNGCICTSRNSTCWLGALERHLEDRRVKRFHLADAGKAPVVEFDRHRRFVGAVDDARHLAATAQTAARTRSLHGTRITL